MADASINLAIPQTSGQKLDAESVVRGAVTYYRERDTVLVAAYPVRDVLSSASLLAGSSVDLDGTTIAASKTGKLISAWLSSSVACKWVIKTRDGAIELSMGVAFTSGISGCCPSLLWEPPDKGFCLLAGNGVDENFRVTATNLDGDNAADVYATIYWDEVPS